MYAIYADDVCIYNDRFALENQALVNPKLTLEDNNAGKLTFSMPPNNAGYNSVARLTTNISVQKEGKEIWAGRVLSEKRDFWNNRDLTCEGELAYFNDSTQPPAEYTGLSVQGFLEKLLAVHNSKVPENRQFTLGGVTVHDAAFPTYVTNYEKTMEILNSLVEKYEGHFRIRKENGKRYLDYLQEYPDTSRQTIQFGSNIIDFVRNWDSIDFATVIVPLGARLDDGPIESLDAYLTIETVNAGSLYLKNEEAFKTFGWIEKMVRWDDVEDANDLLEKGKEYLKSLQFDNMEIEVSALDLHYLDPTIDDVSLLDEIRVISLPHGIDRQFPVRKMTIPLDSPQDTKFTLGDTVQVSLTSVNDKANTAVVDQINKLPKEHTMLDKAKQTATEIMNFATTGYITITKDQYGSDTLYISNIRDYTKADKLWKWNMNGLGYSKDGGQSWEVAITMDGSIVANFITSGVLNGDLIRAGIIQDVAKKNYWNMNTGEFQLTSDARVGSSTVASKSDVDTSISNTFTKEKIFNKLTDNGARQGIYMTTDGELYINATYIATGILADVGKNTTFNLSTGELKITKGEINLGDGEFTVDSNGYMTCGKNATIGGQLNAAKGSFAGKVQAEDFLDKFGNSMMSKDVWGVTADKFKAQYLELYGLTVYDSEGGISFKVATDGAVTINGTVTGNITMSAGSSINWANVSESNLDSSSAYSKAKSAEDAVGALEKKIPTLPKYIESTRITGTSIESCTISACSFYGQTFDLYSEYGAQHSLSLWGQTGSTGSAYWEFLKFGFTNAIYETLNLYDQFVRIYSPGGATLVIGHQYDKTILLGSVDLAHVDSLTLSGYAKTSDLSSYAKTSDLSAYAKTSDLSSYAKSSDLSSYAKSSTVTALETRVKALEDKGTSTTTPSTGK